MLKSFFKFLLIFVFGVLIGISLNYIFFPYFLKFHFSKIPPPAPIYVTQTKEVKIQENTALKEAIEKAEKSIFGVRTKTQKGKIIEGSGIILTSDGFGITLNDLVPKGEKFEIFVDGEKVQFQILKRDLKENLALIKIEKKNLKAPPFFNLENLKLGERVFLVGTRFEKEIKKEVGEGIVKYFNEDVIETNIFEKEKLAGSGLFDIEGNLLGINKITSQGQVISVPVTKIRNFTGL
jgi:S1-C subfamily serine protease